MRVLMVTRENATDKRYGLGRSLQPVVAALQDMGIDCCYLSRGDAGEQGWRLLRRVHAITAPWLSRILRGTDVHSLLWGILERMNMGRLAGTVALREHFTHVHCHDPLIALGLWLRLAGRSGPRWGITEHGFGSYTQALHEDGARLGAMVTRWMRRLEAAVLNRAEWVLLPTRASRAQLVRDLGLSVTPPNWVAIPHPLPSFSRQSREEARARLGWISPQRWILAVGRLVPLKNFESLLRALARLPDDSVHLQILGDGDVGPLFELARQLDIAERVAISVTDDIVTYYAAADVYVSTSRTESFGMANLEAISLGLPALCTAVGGVPEVVGDAAMLVPPDDDVALTAGLSRLLAHAALRAELSSAGLARGQMWPSARQVAALYVEAYRGSASDFAMPDAQPEVRKDSYKTDLPLFESMQPLVPHGALRVLVIAPHADDETLGCGGTIALLRRAGAVVRVLVVTDGRLGDPQGYVGGEVVPHRAEEARRAAGHLGSPELHFMEFEDGALACNPLLINAIASECGAFRPDWVFAPYSDDAHRDHVAVARAGMEACCVAAPGTKFFAYEVWSPVPGNRIVDVSTTLEMKLAALGEYHLPLRYCDYLSGARGLAAYRAMLLPNRGMFAEVFREVPVEGALLGGDSCAQVGT